MVTQKNIQTSEIDFGTLFSFLIEAYGLTAAQADYLISLGIPFTPFYGHLYLTARDLEVAKGVAAKDFAKNVVWANRYPEIQDDFRLLWGWELAEFKRNYLEQHTEQLKCGQLYVLNPTAALRYLIGTDLSPEDIERNHQTIRQEFEIDPVALLEKMIVTLESISKRAESLQKNTELLLEDVKFLREGVELISDAVKPSPLDRLIDFLDDKFAA